MDSRDVADEGDRVLVGRVVKAHGIRGEVMVDVLSDVPGRFDPGARVWSRRGELEVVASRPHQGRLLVTFAGFADRTAAETLRGLQLEAPRALDRDSDHYYVDELLGLRVRGDDGADLGEVIEVIEMPQAAGYDLLEISHPDGHRWLLPASDELVTVEADEGGDDVLVLRDPPEGLID